MAMLVYQRVSGSTLRMSRFRRRIFVKIDFRDRRWSDSELRNAAFCLHLEIYVPINGMVIFHTYVSLPEGIYIWDNRIYCWLMVWNHGILWISIQLGMSSSQLTNSYFSDG